ncbi:MAG: PAS domain S-box protein [Bryobacteraceae bacterium]|nr:PAS domain S-box protein [Bryobacteraceae bacterium]
MALLAVAGAAGLRQLISALLGANAPLLTFTLAVLVAGRFGGLGPGLLATFLSLVSGWFFFVHPRYSLALSDIAEAIRLPLFAVVGISISVLCGRQREALLRVEQSERTAAALLEAASQAIVAVGPDGRIAFANATAERLFGYARSELAGQPVELLVPDAIRDRHKAGRAALLQDPSTRFDAGKPRYGQRKNGSEFLVEIALGVVESPGGRMHVAFLNDITRRQETERALRESEERLRLLSESVPQQLWSCRTDGECDYLNARAVEYTGVPLERLLGFGWLDQVHPDDRAGLIEQWERAASAYAEFRAEFQLRRHDGVYRWFQARALPQRDASGAILKWFGSSTDIHEERELREALRFQGERLANIADAVPGVIYSFRLRPDGTFSLPYASPAMAELWGIKPEDLVDDASALFATTHPGDLAHLRASIAKSARTLAPWRDEIRVLHPVKGEIWIEGYSRPAPEADGSIVWHGFITDVTQRKRAEHELRRYQLVARNSRDIVLFLRLDDGRIVEANAAAEAAYGYRRDELLALTVFDLRAPADRSSARRQMAEADVKSILFEALHQRKDGSVFPVEVSSQGATIEGARMLISVVRDITARRGVEQALRESQADLNRAQAVAHTGSWRLDLARNELIWSAETHRIFDVPVGARLTYKAFLSRVHPEDRQLVDRAWEAALKGQPYDIEHRIIADGQVKWVRERAELDLDVEGRLVAGFGTVQDITARKQAEEALRVAHLELERSLAQLRAVVDHLTEGVIVCDLRGRLLYWNPAALAMHEYVSLEEGQRELAEFHRNYELASAGDGVLPVEQWPLARILRGETIRDVETFVRRRDSQWRRVFKYGGTLARDNRGNPLLAVLSVTDVTEAKRAEEEILRLNAELEQRVRDRTAQLEAANQELEAFSYSVSHDLRAPLRGIDGWSLALLEDYGGQLDVRARQYLNRVRFETQRMGALIDDLLQLSRVSLSEMQRRAVDLTALAHAVAVRLREDEPRRELDFSIQPGLTAPGDPRLLEIALMNLLGNAAKFTAPRDRARIEFGCLEPDGDPVFYVRDNGVGFDMTYAGALFGAFQRLHKTSEFPGSGIGLATVQRVIRRHGGRLWAEAEVDRGATFYFTLGDQ